MRRLTQNDLRRLVREEIKKKIVNENRDLNTQLVEMMAILASFIVGSIVVHNAYNRSTNVKKAHPKLADVFEKAKTNINTLNKEDEKIIEDFIIQLAQHMSIPGGIIADHLGISQIEDYLRGLPDDKREEALENAIKKYEKTLASKNVSQYSGKSLGDIEGLIFYDNFKTFDFEPVHTKSFEIDEHGIKNSEKGAAAVKLPVKTGDPKLEPYSWWRENNKLDNSQLVEIFHLANKITASEIKRLIKGYKDKNLKGEDASKFMSILAAVSIAQHMKPINYVIYDGEHKVEVPANQIKKLDKLFFAMGSKDGLPSMVDLNVHNAWLKIDMMQPAQLQKRFMEAKYKNLYRFSDVNTYNFGDVGATASSTYRESRNRRTSSTKITLSELKQLIRSEIRRSRLG